MSYLMGIDIGSTNLKAGIYDYNGKMIAYGKRSNEISYLNKKHPKYAYWHPDKIWNSVASAIKEAVSKIDSPKKIMGVAVTGMGADGVLVDKKGKWIYPFISWHCPRSLKITQSWEKNIDLKKIYFITGNPILSYHSIYRLIWLKENEPELLKKADKWLLIEDYINFMLCDNKVTDYSMASTTSLFDQKKHNWSDVLLEIAGIDKKLMTDILPSGTFIGKINSQAAMLTGLCKDTPVILGGHDYHCAALATGATEPGVVMDIVGTWEIILTSSSELILSRKTMDAGLLIESHVIKNLYSITGASVGAGILEWFCKDYCFEEKLQANQNENRALDLLMGKSKNIPCGSNGVFFLPHLYGSSCPHANSFSLGAFIGLNSSTGKIEMARAIIEGLNYQFREILESFENTLKINIKKIVMSGGGTKNTFWMENKADITGKNIEVPDSEESTTFGAAILAGIGIGIYKDRKDILRIINRKVKIYKPNISSNRQYNQYFKLYKKIYPSLKDLNFSIRKKFTI